MDMLDEEWVNELREQQELLKEFAYIQQRRQVWLTQQAYLTGVEVGKRYPR